MERAEIFSLRNWIPEGILVVFGLFFFVREFGTFPAAWTDDSLFMIVAREIAQGNGYALPILEHSWKYPYILAVGPTVILPSAISMMIFGESIASARLPMMLYLMGTSVSLYVFSYRIAGKQQARFATALLLSLSAFVNTGKTVMGEVPGIFFLLLALVFFTKPERKLWNTVICGFAIGLSVITKISSALIYPALGCAFLYALHKRYRMYGNAILIIGACSLIPIVLLSPLLGVLDPGFFVELNLYTTGMGQNILPKYFFLSNPEILLRIPFVAYAALLSLGIAGMTTHWKKDRNILLIIIIGIFVLESTLYFLSRSGWYRHLLAAHILLLPYVPDGSRSIFGKRGSIVLLSAIIAAQGWWQLTYKGSSRSTAAAETAQYVEEHLQDTDVIIQIAPVYVRLEKNPRWLFLTNPILTSRLPKELVTFTERQRCSALLRGWEEGDENKRTIAGKYVLIPPQRDECQ
ncbi:hypothetical protein A2454_03195 [Candidatus Peribacteria bacterium RIFOXYC2_FULL_55_14]|nr:MAG: hypothetical protein UY85_C0047G0006 [Candidatus Peribacteria bacterium GW2011_GWB1_54_5]KKW38932.1 MAG: hypothetical protein UY87_C0058G0004 [Candidatus Peribacteria bacterium GW2011_GWC2_54_8]KKW44174.1 MAG: hypothetical protein UY90_C0018G0024 [Candidatus Peregrinibacteria bacterium GW2011_GWA2_54_9]OGJ71173.1 MAG: hypothetical protein A2198_01570 [Candidatus Peribacteria bacterium RIFOXYA1_FULL_56_14]OGJ73808.1 MAG: hypothetical protein A2384_04515 [Candidatus Peribacteria bacterium